MRGSPFIGSGYSKKLMACKRRRSALFRAMDSEGFNLLVVHLVLNRIRGSLANEI